MCNPSMCCVLFLTQGTVTDVCALCVQMCTVCVCAPLDAVMWRGIVICCALLAQCLAAPPAHINRLALFPDKSAWCEAKNITQIVGHTGCQPRSIQNRSEGRHMHL